MLLDENLEPRIADFGVSRAQNKETEFTRGTYETTHAIGTPGYAPPESQFGLVSHKTDVVSGDGMAPPPCFSPLGAAAVLFAVARFFSSACFVLVRPPLPP